MYGTALMKMWYVAEFVHKLDSVNLSSFLKGQAQR